MELLLRFRMNRPLHTHLHSFGPESPAGDTETLGVLIEHGGRPCLKTEHGWTPAHCAAEFGRLAVLRLLHSRHAPIDKQDCCGDKPARIAEVYGHTDCVTFLRRLDTKPHQ